MLLKQSFTDETAQSDVTIRRKRSTSECNCPAGPPGPPGDKGQFVCHIKKIKNRDTNKYRGREKLRNETSLSQKKIKLTLSAAFKKKTKAV